MSSFSASCQEPHSTDAAGVNRRTAEISLDGQTETHRTRCNYGFTFWKWQNICRVGAEGQNMKQIISRHRLTTQTYVILILSAFAAASLMLAAWTVAPAHLYVGLDDFALRSTKLLHVLNLQFPSYNSRELSLYGSRTGFVIVKCEILSYVCTFTGQDSQGWSEFGLIATVVLLQISGGTEFLFKLKTLPACCAAHVSHSCRCVCYLKLDVHCWL